MSDLNTICESCKRFCYTKDMNLELAIRVNKQTFENTNTSIFTDNSKMFKMLYPESFFVQHVGITE